MRTHLTARVGFAVSGLSAATALVVSAAMQQPPASRPADAVEAAQTSKTTQDRRPELQKREHDDPNRFKATNAAAVDRSLADQPRGGENTGFDFYRDGLNTDKPMVRSPKSSSRMSPISRR